MCTFMWILFVDVVVFIHQSLLDMMVKEEESLKKRLVHSIQTCKAELETLYLELQLPVFEVTTSVPT